MDPSQRERFTGRIYVKHNRDHAVAFADMAASQGSTDEYTILNLFCDGSMDVTDTNRGGISVVYQPPAPGRGGSHRDLVGAAWPVNPVYDCALGELLAVSEALTTALHQISELDSTTTTTHHRSGKPTLVRIFNDNMFNIEYLAAATPRQLAPHLLTLAEPVLALIAVQSWALQNMRPGIQLELHWMPGHFHRVRAHCWADELAKGARASGWAFDSTRKGSPWFRGAESESCVVPFLREELDLAAAKSGRCGGMVVQAGRVPVEVY
ncbi:uncharacterized protein B0H64DRAFT_410866 [Chaetomium fimeti]|uniref:RNase H type-1 domain-containing protein n=1 Tax=Chaetomium fimeti TaxID=1854472 RepID=A0AAE0LMQ8_9PEZI|nr:hypothetical protein B0H64DRAFT_410866 [Chaetomium fimeti]